MVVISGWYPSIADKPARAKEVLRAESDDLQPLPNDKNGKTVVIHGGKYDVVHWTCGHKNGINMLDEPQEPFGQMSSRAAAISLFEESIYSMDDDSSSD